MSPRNPRTFASAFAVFAMVTLLSLFCFRGCGADDLSPLQNSPEVLHLRTDGLPTPLVILGDPLKRLVTFVEIRGELTSGGDGMGTITLDESIYAFNEFGDATKTQAKAAEPSQVAFRLVKQEEWNKDRQWFEIGTYREHQKRRLFEVVFADGSFAKRMHLVLSDGTTGPHCLLIHGGEDPEQERQLAQYLNLKGEPEVKETLADVPFRSTFNLTTLSSYHARQGHLARIGIGGTLDGFVHLQLDPNFLRFDVLGDIRSTTLIGYSPIKSTLVCLEIPDPAKKGRRLFEVVTNDSRLKDRFFLVLSPMEAGSHRLLIRQGDVLRHVLPLHDPDRRYHSALQPQLAESSPQEQQAVADLRADIGYKFRIKFESRAITELEISSGDDADRIDDALRGLTNLKSLYFHRSRLGTAGLTNLPWLTQLKSLSFWEAPIADAGLANLKRLPRLNDLIISQCQGISDEGLAHLGLLKNLRSLRLHSYELGRPGERRITDAGLAHFKGLTNLESLNLNGLAFTDAGVENLKGLTNLKELHLSGMFITDAGLGHLKGMSHLELLDIQHTGITPTGYAALKSRFPNLQIEADARAIPKPKVDFLPPKVRIEMTAQMRAAYVFGNEKKTAESFKKLLDEHRIQTDIIHWDDASRMDYSPYAVILIGSDVEGRNASTIQKLVDSKSPILAIGEGGSVLFGSMQLRIGAPMVWHGSKTTVAPVSPTESVFWSSLNLQAPAEGGVVLYQESRHVGVHVPDPIEGVVFLGREADDQSHYPFIQQNPRYLLWGFTGSPEHMTEAGRRVFVHGCRYAAALKIATENGPPR